MCRTVWSLQTDVDYVHSVVADLEKEWVHLLIETLWRSENAPSPSDVCMCHQWPPFLQVFYRTEFRLAGGDLPTSRLLPWPRQPQGDFRRLQRESQVSIVHTVHVTPVLSVSPVPWHLIRTKCNRNHYGNFGEVSPERVEMHESYTDEYKDESGEKWEGASKRELLGRLPRYLVFHRHFSKSDQGHQQQHPLSFSLQCSLLLSSVVLFLAT